MDVFENPIPDNQSFNDYRLCTIFANKKIKLPKEPTKFFPDKSIFKGLIIYIRYFGLTFWKKILDFYKKF